MTAYKPNYLSTAELARILGISRVAVLKRIQKGSIPAVKIGRGYAIPESVVIEQFPKYKTLLPVGQEYVSVLEAARILGVSRSAVSKRIERGCIEVKRVGRRYVIRKEHIVALKNQVSAEVVTDKEYLSIPEYARLRQVSRIAIYKQVKKGILPARRIGRHYVIDVSHGARLVSEDVPGKGYWSVAETAEYWGISRIAVFKKIVRGDVKAIKIGRSYAILPGEVTRHTPGRQKKKHSGES